MRRKKGDKIVEANKLGASSMRHVTECLKRTECVGKEPLVLVFFSANPFAMRISFLFKRCIGIWIKYYFDNKREQKREKKNLIPEELCPSLAGGLSGQTGGNTVLTTSDR